MQYSKQEVEEARKTLLNVLKPGDLVYTVLRHVSSSGMIRDISLVVFDGERKYTLDWSVARVLGLPLSKNDGVKVGGCGMDMGLHLVYGLGSVLFRSTDGWECIGDNCPYNEHFNDSKTYPRQKGLKHTGDSGYTLRQEWI
jgi:hypothetical protein